MVGLAPVLRLAVIRHAVPAGVASRAACEACEAPIGLGRPWPVLGPTARCGRCGARVGPAPGAVELAVAAALGVLVLLGLAGGAGGGAGGGWAGGGPAVLAATAWWLGWAIPLVFVDVAVHRLPDRLTWPAAAGTWLLLGLAALAGAGPAPWLRATAAGVALGSFFAATTLLLGPRGFGLGDAKLALGVGALLGWHGWAVAVCGLLLALVLSGLVSAALLATRRVGWRSHLPFGPFLVLGVLGALLLP
ncbi:prepilin peptidase [Micromonospora sp. KLBMP9576]|uniref:prepilin peptidase n=1 Tax=Micromonospora sp. KLBMP9576 TaxID=3424769 RepID=UPI003D924E2C